MEFNKKIVDWWRQRVDLKLIKDLAILNNVLIMVHIYDQMGKDDCEMSHTQREMMSHSLYLGYNLQH